MLQVVCIQYNDIPPLGSRAFLLGPLVLLSPGPWCHKNERGLFLLFNRDSGTTLIEIIICFPLRVPVRPHLPSADTFGYKLVPGCGLNDTVKTGSLDLLTGREV